MKRPMQAISDCQEWSVVGEGTADALTNDRHFEQEGSRALFLEP
jgi:hypothetical protein